MLAFVATQLVSEAAEETVAVAVHALDEEALGREGEREGGILTFVLALLAPAAFGSSLGVGLLGAAAVVLVLLVLLLLAVLVAVLAFLLAH